MLQTSNRDHADRPRLSVQEMLALRALTLPKLAPRYGSLPYSLVENVELGKVENRYFRFTHLPPRLGTPVWQQHIVLQDSRAPQEKYVAGTKAKEQLDLELCRLYQMSPYQLMRLGQDKATQRAIAEPGPFLQPEWCYLGTFGSTQAPLFKRFGLGPLDELLPDVFAAPYVPVWYRKLLVVEDERAGFVLRELARGKLEIFTENTEIRQAWQAVPSELPTLERVMRFHETLKKRQFGFTKELQDPCREQATPTSFHPGIGSLLAFLRCSSGSWYLKRTDQDHGRMVMRVFANDGCLRVESDVGRLAYVCARTEPGAVAERLLANILSEGKHFILEREIQGETLCGKRIEIRFICQRNVGAAALWRMRGNYARLFPRALGGRRDYAATEQVLADLYMQRLPISPAAAQELARQKTARWGSDAGTLLARAENWMSTFAQRDDLWRGDAALDLVPVWNPTLQDFTPYLLEFQSPYGDPGLEHVNLAAWDAILAHRKSRLPCVAV